MPVKPKPAPASAPIVAKPTVEIAKPVEKIDNPASPLPTPKA
jgi:hypothetical protein